MFSIMQTRFPKLLRSMPCCLLIAFFSISASASCVGDQQSNKIYKVSVVPQKSPSEIFSVWSQLLDRVGKKAGMCFTLTLQSNIQDFEARLLTGEPDFSWVNPYHALMAHNKHGYRTLVRDGGWLVTS
ncbi:MAG: PhnD/SsuA/transferrin family substrate-binding protein [Burkholderiaceae bacterium]|nr:PhnD/SsuA/transferrin family substrate-binding protein [Burkholderiaceae bacterium]